MGRSPRRRPRHQRRVSRPRSCGESLHTRKWRAAHGCNTIGVACSTCRLGPSISTEPVDSSSTRCPTPCTSTTCSPSRSRSTSCSAARLVHPRPKIVLAPRGQLDPPALNLKRLKKQIFLHVCRPLRIFRDVHWQASSDVEAEEIRRNFGPDVAVTVARNLRVPSEVPRPAVEKVPGQLRAVFLSRVSPKKNLHFALTLLEHLRGTVFFTIAGPVDDPAYWERCQRIIHHLPPNVTIDCRGAVPNEEVAALLAGHDLLLLPTLSENFGHVIVEALQVGTPVLISDQTPWRDLEQRHAGGTSRSTTPRHSSRHFSHASTSVPTNSAVYRLEPATPFQRSRTTTWRSTPIVRCSDSRPRTTALRSRSNDPLVVDSPLEDRRLVGNGAVRSPPHPAREARSAPGRTRLRTTRRMTTQCPPALGTR